MPNRLVRGVRGLALAFTLALPLFGTAPIARAQETPPPPVEDGRKPVERAPWLLREKAYFVPYAELEKALQATGPGIFLPYEEFIRLWRDGKPEPRPEEPAPPAPTVVRGGQYVGEVLAESARFEVGYVIESLAKGFTTADLPLKGVALETVELSDARAILQSWQGGYRVLLPEPGRYEVKLRFSVRVQRSPGLKSVRLTIPETTVSRLELTIPEAQARVEVAPSLVVTSTEPAEGATKVLAFLGTASEVVVSWQPPVGNVQEQAPLVFARQSSQVYLGERILRVSTAISYEVLRGEVATLKVRMPEDMRIIAVKGEGIREWAPQDGILTVALHAAAKKGYELALSFERVLDETPKALTVSFPRAEDVLRESGHVALSHDDGLSVRVAGTKGLSQLDPEEVPEGLRRGLAVGFRYLAHPLELTLAVEKILPVVRAASVSVVTLGREEDQWVGFFDYDITRAGLFKLAFRVPKGWAVDTVGTPGNVEEYQQKDDATHRTIEVSLKSKALGGYRLPFRLTREGTARVGTQELFAPAALDVQQDRGLFAVAAPRALEIATTKLTGLRDADLDELLRTGIMGQVSTEAGVPRTLRFREQPAAATIELKEKRTEVDVLAQHLIEVSDGEVRTTHLFDYDVLFAPTETLVVRAPKALDDRIKFDAKQKTEVTRKDGESGESLWTVRFQPPVIGAVTLTITHKADLEGLAPGAPRTQAIPLVRPALVRAEQGFVAIRKEGTLEIVPEVEALETLDAGDLPDKLRRGQVYSAFRYFGANPALTLKLTRYEYESLATTAVQLLRMQSVVSQERRMKTEATLFVQNTERQYLELELGADARILSLTVAGRSQSPKKRKEGGGTLIQIPRSAGPGGTFPIVLVYEENLGAGDMGTLGDIALVTPKILEGVPVAKTELELYLPQGFVYFGFAGTLHPRMPRTQGLYGVFRELLSLSAATTSTGPGSRRVEVSPGDAVSIEIPTEGYQRLDFDTLAASSRLELRFLARKVYGALGLGLLAVVFALALRAIRRAPGAALCRGATLSVFLLAGSWLVSAAFADVLRGCVLALACGWALGGSLELFARVNRGFARRSSSGSAASAASPVIVAGAGADPKPESAPAAPKEDPKAGGEPKKEAPRA